MAQVPVAGGIGKKPDAVSVQNTASDPSQPMSDADFIRTYSQPRNYGLNTIVPFFENLVGEGRIGY